MACSSTRERAIAHGRELAAAGADLLDVGGESTRPGAEAVPADAELERVVPVVEGLAGADVPISVDTSKAAVAAAGLDAGAAIVNDVTAFRADPDMAPLCADRGCTVVLMHMLGDPRTMQDDPRYDDVVDDVASFLAERIEYATANGVDEQRIWIDPGIGFGKTVEHNLELLRRLGELSEARAADRDRHLTQALSWHDHRARGRRQDRRDDRLERPRARRGCRCLSRPRRAPRRVRRSMSQPCSSAGPSGVSVQRAWTPIPDGAESSVQVELRGLSIYTHHGVTDAEQEIGQRLVIDISFDVPDCDAVLTDRLEDTIDYAEVADIVALAATERSYRTLERLCGVIAERLMERFGSDLVRVRAAKPEPPIPLAIEEVAVEVVRERGLDGLDEEEPEEDSEP